MRPNPAVKAHALAALEATLCAEMVKLQTMAFATAHAGSTVELEPAVSAWISDWRDYQQEQTDNPITRACLSVAMGEISSMRVSAAVWHHFRTEFDTLTTPARPQPAITPAEPAPPSQPGLSIIVPQNVPAKLATEIEVNGEVRTVAACVAKVLHEVANGAEVIRMRPETRAKLEAQVPEAAALIGRDPARKVIAKLAWYKVRAIGWCRAA